MWGPPIGTAYNHTITALRHRVMYMWSDLYRHHRRHRRSLLEGAAAADGLDSGSADGSGGGGALLRIGDGVERAAWGDGEGTGLPMLPRSRRQLRSVGQR